LKGWRGPGQIRPRDPTTRDVPIIFVTATDETEENLLRGYGARVVDYLEGS
jgi:CheY-like chemotaxis protein